jgi:hypothetical protein
MREDHRALEVAAKALTLIPDENGLKAADRD